MTAKPQRQNAPGSTRADAPGSLYTSNEVARIAGVSLRQLQWWDERGELCPQIVSGRGKGGAHRAYTEDEVEAAVRIAELRKAGASLNQIRKILKSGVVWKSVVGIRKPTLVGDVLVVPRV